MKFTENISAAVKIPMASQTAVVLINLSARRQLELGWKRIANLNHRPVDITDPVSVELIKLLDGTRDHASLVEELTALVACGGAPLQHYGSPVSDPHQARKILAEELEMSLRKLASLALLVG